MLGIPADDTRPLTVTGGLPYFGGPGNNYSTHAIATMTERLRERPDAIGLITANGWYVTKHSVGVYGGEPPARPWRRADPREDQARVDVEPRPQAVAEPAGPATVETYTVLFDREGAPERAIVIGRDAEDRRFIANTPNDPQLLESMCVDEPIGSRGRVRQVDGRNVFEPS